MLSISQEAITRMPQGTSSISSSTSPHSGITGGRFYFLDSCQLLWILHQTPDTLTHPADHRKSQSKPLYCEVQLLKVLENQAEVTLLASDIIN